jgi:universal stress protein A
MARANKRAELHVVHVVPPPVGIVGVTAATPTAASQYVDVMDAARAELEDLCRSEAAELGDRIYGHVRTGEAARELVSLAREVAADLIVIGTHGRKGIGRVLLGSICESVVRHAPCSVLTARASPTPPGIEPACADCARRRRDTKNPRARCEHHTPAHPVMQPHAFFRFGT